MGEILNCFKGFNKDMKCRDFQYEIGGEYTEESADICNSGFHACESPLEVFGYYPPGSGSRYCKVELDANDQKDDDSKRVGKHIKIGAATSRGRSASRNEGISVARGNDVRAKGGMGSLLVIAEEEIDSYKIKEWKAAVVDGEKIKPDVWYRLEDGELIECMEDAKDGN